MTFKRFSTVHTLSPFTFLNQCVLRLNFYLKYDFEFRASVNYPDETLHYKLTDLNLGYEIETTNRYEFLEKLQEYITMRSSNGNLMVFPLILNSFDLLNNSYEKSCTSLNLDEIKKLETALQESRDLKVTYTDVQTLFNDLLISTN